MNAIRLASKYDDKIVILLLMVCFERLNLSIVVIVTTTNDEKLELEQNMFEMGVSVEESSQTLVTAELSLLKKFYVSSSACANPLTWWHMHEGQFPNVGFLAKHILGILDSQIEIGQVFSLVGVLTTLRCCLQVDKWTGSSLL